MGVYHIVDVAVPGGLRAYIFRGHAQIRFDRLEDSQRPLGKDDFPEAGGSLVAECWGPDMRGPFRDVLLSRSPDGWVEIESNIITPAETHDSVRSSFVGRVRALKSLFIGR